MKLYRYEKTCHDETLLDWHGNSNVTVDLTEYEVQKTTLYGYWIKVNGKLKWTSSNSKRRYAYDTKEEALKSFIKGAERSIHIMNHYIAYTKLAIEYANKLYKEK